MATIAASAGMSFGGMPSRTAIGGAAATVTKNDDDRQQQQPPAAPQSPRILPLDEFTLRWLDHHASRNSASQGGNNMMGSGSTSAVDKKVDGILIRYLDEQLHGVLSTIEQQESRRLGRSHSSSRRRTMLFRPGKAEP